MLVLNKENIFVPPRRQVQQADCQAGHAFRSAPPPAWLKYSKTFSQEFLSHCILHSFDQSPEFPGLITIMTIIIIMIMIMVFAAAKWWGPLFTIACCGISFGIVVFADGEVLLLQWLIMILYLVLWYLQMVRSSCYNDLWSLPRFFGDEKAH